MSFPSRHHKKYGILRCLLVFTSLARLACVHGMRINTSNMTFVPSANWTQVNETTGMQTASLHTSVTMDFNVNGRYL